MKYRKNEAKEYARTNLKGVWTALPTNFTADDRLDEAGTAFNLDHCISELKIAGHYCLGNVAEFWSMTNQERMRVHEINVAGRERPHPADRRLPPPEPLRGGQSLPARLGLGSRFRHHPDALRRVQQRRCRLRFL